MSELALVGIDLGKHSFHLHGQDKPGRELFRKKLSRQQMMRFFSNLPACTVNCKSGGDHRFFVPTGISTSGLIRISPLNSSRD